MILLYILATIGALSVIGMAGFLVFVFINTRRERKKEADEDTSNNDNARV